MISQIRMDHACCENWIHKRVAADGRPEKINIPAPYAPTEEAAVVIVTLDAHLARQAVKQVAPPCLSLLFRKFESRGALPTNHLWPSWTRAQ